MPRASKRNPRLIEYAREMRKAPMPAERWLWNIVRNHRLEGLHFRRQAPIGPFIADFICEEAKVIVELDGSTHETKVAYDDDRQAYLESLGYQVLRFGSIVSVSDGDEIPEIIAGACRQRLRRIAPPPCPPPHEGAGEGS